MKKVLFLIAVATSLLSCSKEVSCWVTVSNSTNKTQFYQIYIQDKNGDIVSYERANYIQPNYGESSKITLKKGYNIGLLNGINNYDHFDYYDCKDNFYNEFEIVN